jgi:hypothetical protein
MTKVMISPLGALSADAQFHWKKSSHPRDNIADFIEEELFLDRIRIAAQVIWDLGEPICVVKKALLDEGLNQSRSKDGSLWFPVFDPRDIDSWRFENRV